jgi:crotonobetainyl-CoA:carnitine CoA-transferase CaiB-like acyl-CoA transferase
MPTTRTGPEMLSGVTVLDFTRFLAGPTCTRILGDLGAEIIKIEPPPAGDFARQMAASDDTQGIGPMFLYTSAGKKSLCVDLKTAEGLDIVRRLVAKVDVVADNFAPGVMGRFGLDYPRLREINPAVIAVSISGFGQFGPWAKNTSYDLISQALSGVMHMTGDPDGPPQYVGNNVGDPVAGLHAALAVCGALFHRARTGRGQLIDISQVDSLLWIDMFNTSISALSQGRRRPRRFGSHHFAFAPLGVFHARDGYIVMHVFDQHWPGLAEALERPDLVHDPRFATNADRVANRPALIAIIEGWLQQFATRDDAIARLQTFRIPCAPVLDIQEALDHPQIRARDMVGHVTHPVLGRHPIVQTPFHLSETPGRVQGPAPLLGEHNADVLGHYLGYEEAEIGALYEKGVLVAEKR